MEGVLGLAGGGSKALSNDILTKLKKAEKKATVDPFDKKLKHWDKEVKRKDEIGVKIKDLSKAISTFDLFKKGGNIFRQKTAATTGESVVFDAKETGQLATGTRNVEVVQVAKKSVLQTLKFDNKDDQIIGGNRRDAKILIDVKGTRYEFSTQNKTYDQLAKEINTKENIEASVEKVGDDKYRIIIKGTEVGKENQIVIREKKLNLGFSQSTDSRIFSDLNYHHVSRNAQIVVNGRSIDLTAGESILQVVDKINEKTEQTGVVAKIVNHRMRLTNKQEGGFVSFRQRGNPGFNFSMGTPFSSEVIEAQNSKIKVDGIEYDLPKNKIELSDGLMIDIKKEGKSTISIQNDDVSIVPSMKKLIDSYNELTKIIDEETYGKDKVIEDMSSFKMMMSGIKEKLFSGYGENHDLSLFSVGVSLNKDGSLSLNEDTFKKAISENRDGLESLFLGVAENKGLGTQIKEYLDDLNGYNGIMIMTKFDEKLKEDKTELEKDKEEAEKALKEKYKQMSLQFAAYGTIIAQMEAAFGGMKMMIQQSLKG